MSDVNSRQTRPEEVTMPNGTNNEEGARSNVSRRNFFKQIGVAGAAAATTGPVPAAAQTPAMATEVSVDDRFRIQDVLRSYVQCRASGRNIHPRWHRAAGDRRAYSRAALG